MLYGYIVHSVYSGCMVHTKSAAPISCMSLRRCSQLAARRDSESIYIYIYIYRPGHTFHFCLIFLLHSFKSYYAGCEGRSEKSDLKGGVCGRSFATSRICKIIFAGCSLSSTYVINLAGVQLLISLYNDDTLTISDEPSQGPAINIPHGVYGSWPRL